MGKRHLIQVGDGEMPLARKKFLPPIAERFKQPGKEEGLTVAGTENWVLS